MPIPDFQTLMLPFLRHLEDGHERANKETLDTLARQFKLTDQERTIPLKSGPTPVFSNRVGWAKTHLKWANLIESPQPGVSRISPRGTVVLNGNPERVDLQLLRTFPEYQKARSPKQDGNPIGSRTHIEPAKEQDGLTPEEHLEYGHQSIREELAIELLRRVKAATPAFFEQVVVELLVAMGYGGSRQDAGRTLGRSGDGGVDGLIKEDSLGLDVIYVQAKKWEATVGRPEIQKFAGALQGQRAKKGVFFTTSDFSSDAEQYATHIETKIVLIDGATLAGLMIDHGVGVTSSSTYVVKKIDSDYFEDV